jgi:hypothetical protein
MNDTSNRKRHQRGDLPAGGTRVNVTVLEERADYERIARRAFDLYEARGHTDGHADEDWFQAASEDAAREPVAVEQAGASDSFGDRTRRGRR